MILSDGAIRKMLASGRLTLQGPDGGTVADDCVQPASVDVTLGPDFIVMPFRGHAPVDPENLPDRLGVERTLRADEQFVLSPGAFALGATAETVGVPDDVVALAEGKSSLARLGLLIHITAGFIDPGFRGRVTLELYNVAPFPLVLRPGMKIGQLAFEKLDRPAQRPYGHPDLGSRYQDQSGATASRYGRRSPALAG